MIRMFVLAAAVCSLSIPAVEAEPAKATAAAVDGAIPKLEAAAAKEIADQAVAGIAIAVVFEDKLVYAKGFGVRDTATGEPIDADTVFQIASMSKPVGSTVVAALVGDGRITWDSKIADLYPGFAMYTPWVTSQITLRDFYAHRSGLPDHAGDALEDLGYDRAEVIRRLRYQRPDSSFRAGYAYTNFGMTIAAEAAAMAYGKTWEDVSKERLYTPLGMTSTSSRYADFWAQTNKALGHQLIDGKWVHGEQRMPDAQSPAGGVSSTVKDLAKWMRLQLAGGKFDGKQVVDGAALAATHEPVILVTTATLSGIPQFYGLGWNVNYTDDGRLKLSHSGAFALGAGTVAVLSPFDDLGIVVLTNSAPNGVAEGLANAFVDNVLYGKQTHDWLKLYKGAFEQMVAAEDEASQVYLKPPAAALPAAPLSDYAGTFANDFAGDIAIAEKDGGLVLAMGPKQETVPLTHFSGNVFTYPMSGENATGLSGVIFTLGPDGKATSVTVDQINVTGEGIFDRKTE
jgi:CubicO group peptidase (beta-lactamase class C family)